MFRSRWMALLAVTPLALAACGTEEGDTPSLNDGPVKRAFENASIAEGVPEDLLLALAWTETRWTHELNAHEEEEDEEGHTHDMGLYGIMQLGARGETNTLVLASELTGQEIETLRTDLAWNVRGGASVLRRYADEMYEGLDVEQLDLFAWRDVVAVWTGIDELDPAYKVAEEVFAVMRDGAGLTLPSGENLELFPNPGLGTPDDSELGQTQGELTGVAGVRFYAAHSDHFGGTNNPTHIVIHTMQGSYAGSQSWARKSAAQRKKESGVASKSSAQYYLKSSNGEVTQMVSEDQQAYHARNWNHKSIGLEHEGFVNNPAWYTDAMYRSSARIVCDMADRWDIPLDRTHIISHQQIDPGRRTDPGPNWDWDYYMSLLEACSGGTAPDPKQPTQPDPKPPVQPGTGLLQGMVYTGGNANNRVSGASIRLNNGQTATSDSNGYWSLRVAPGNHTVTATKSGYQASSVTRTVTSNSQVWASTNLTQAPVSTTGVVTGVVYDSANTATRLAGASVKVGGKSVTTDANGRYSVELPAGTTSVEASADGYVKKTTSTTVRVGQSSTVNVALVKNAPASTGAGAIQGVIYTAPNVSDPVAGAQVTVTSGSQTFSVTSGGNGYFEVKNVPAGTWRVTASAPDYGAGSKSVTVTTNSKPWGSIGLRKLAKEAGQGTLTGVIYESPTTSRRLKGATVSLSSGVSVTTDGNGVYTVGAAGAVTAIGSYPGFAPRAVTRTVPTGRTVWGSIGLVKGGTNSDVVGSECIPTAPKVPGGRSPPYSVSLISPIDGTPVDPNNATFEFWGVGDPTAKYRLVLVRADDTNNPNEEFDAGMADANNKVTFKLPKRLEENIWIWSGYARWDDCETTPAVSWGFFSTYQ